MALMIQAIKVAICWLALLQLGFALQLGDASNESKEQKLCDNKHLKLRDFSDVWRTTTDECDPEVKLAFEEFKDSVATEWHDVCTMEKVTNLTRFFDNHLRNKPTGQAGDGEGTTLPLEFVNYAVGYGMELGGKCRSVLHGFYKNSEGKLDRSDFEALEEWIGHNGPVARLLDPISKQAQFPLASDFIHVMPEFEDSYKTVLKLADSDKYNRAEEVCAKRFRPLYEPLILAISHLGRNGFTYNMPQVSRELHLNQRDRNRYARWSRIVFFCESLKVIQFVEEPKQVGVVPGEEAGQQIDAPKELEPIKPYSLKTDFRGPEFWTMFDLRLNNAVRHYKLSMSDADRFESRLLQNKGKLLLAAFKSKETMASLVERAFEIVSRQRDGKEADQLESTKKNLMSLLDSDKKSEFVEVLTKMATGGEWVLRKFAILLEIMLVMVAGLLALSGGFIALVSILVVGTGRVVYKKLDHLWKKMKPKKKVLVTKED